ncbi:lymphocyte antigen 75-like isoform X2 [Aricia agestis]|uniref:lymphocyte antigen 75-like isoform X2 n=1 Tax=Aricia agestis TaxID=91739 RepID=UPI001C209612|nr:lymphocyte antigen 75-like isoform X2 [Aricia agestis]
MWLFKYIAFTLFVLIGAVLASPNDFPLLGGLKRVIADNVGTSRGVYLGANARFSKGDFSSIAGVPLARMPVDWLPNEPDNLDNNEECLMMMSNGSIADVSCSRVLPYVCYKKSTPDMLINDCGTTDKEYNLEPRTGSCYKFHRVSRTWPRAYMACTAEGGHLAIINSQQEALVLKEIFANNSPAQVSINSRETMHIGIHNWNERADWTTINGEPIPEPEHHVYFQGQPDTEEFCGGMMRDGELGYSWCGVIRPFVCEMKPDSLQQEINK